VLCDKSYFLCLQICLCQAVVVPLYLDYTLRMKKYLKHSQYVTLDSGVEQLFACVIQVLKSSLNILQCVYVIICR